MRKQNTNNQDPKNNDLKIIYSHNTDHWATPFPSIILSFTKDIFKVSFALPTYFQLDPDEQYK